MKKLLLIVAVVGLLLVGQFQPYLLGADVQAAPQGKGLALEPPALRSLRQLSIDGLRQRAFTFQSTMTIEEQLGDATGSSDYSQFYGEPYYNTYMASYQSDGLRVYSRVDLPPGQMPEAGWPVIIFAHGWVGAEGAPGYKFNYGAEAYYGDLLDAYVKAGFIVLTPGFRGHGTVKEVPAEGLAYIEAYDNGSYLSPIFYAIDILNLLGGVDSLEAVEWSAWGNDAIKVDANRIYLTGHSQGGDAAFTALTVSTAPQMKNLFAAVSIWAGSIEGRIEQGAFFGAQEASADALTDPAYFAHMPSWWDPAWYPGNLTDGIAQKKAEMYDTVRTYVADQANANPATNSLAPVMARLDAARHVHYITVPLDLHYSDMDHYSIPEWNEGVVRKIRALGGSANAYLYAGNSHEFETAEDWSPADAVAGRESALERTIALFNSTP